MNTSTELPFGNLQREPSEAGADGPRFGGRPRSVARLAAVQALYQLELNKGMDPEAVVREFGRHRLGQEIDGDRYGDADPALFAGIVRGVATDLERLDASVSEVLTEEWPLS